jgi:hypothetical protein
LWVPGDALDEFNRHIGAPIAVPVAYFGAAFTGEVPGRYLLAGRNATEQLGVLSDTLTHSSMDFTCEISANAQAVFLNYAFWQSCVPAAAALSPERRQAVLDAVRHCWAARGVEMDLPYQGECAA